LVDRSLLRQANALANLSRSLTRIVGALLGGVVVSTLGSGAGLALDAMTFAVAGAIYLRIHLPPIERQGASSIWADLAEGWSEFTSRRWIWVTVVGFAVVNACIAGAWYTLGPVAADATFGRSWWGILLALMAAGVLGGTLLMAHTRPPSALVLGIGLTLTYAPLFSALAWAPHPLLLSIGSVLVGIGGGVFGVAWYTALHTHVSEDRISRVISHDSFWSYAAIPVGQLSAGLLSERLGVETVLVLAAATSALATVAMLSSPSVRDISRRGSTTEATR
jgi:predicted MFS family arabinose efflux permease